MAEFSEPEEAAPAPKTKKGKKAQDEDEDSDNFDMDVSDDGAFVDSDEDLPSDIELGGMDLTPADVPAPAESDRKKRRKLKQLPTFASADDYAALLADDDDGM
jgi:ribosome biogenesis protein MAK21